MLLLEKVPPGKSSTANVKPSPEAGAAVRTDYEAGCDGLLAAVGGARNLKTQARYEHSWFGALDASGWHALAARHMGIHRKQIERILKG